MKVIVRDNFDREGPGAVEQKVVAGPGLSEQEAQHVHPFIYYSASTCGPPDRLCFAVNVPNARGQVILYRPAAVRVVDRYGNLSAPPLEDAGTAFRCVPKSWW